MLDDQATYDANVAQLLAAYEATPADHESIKVLIKVSFDDRRKLMSSGIEPGEVLDFLEKNCPFLKEPRYV